MATAKTLDRPSVQALVLAVKAHAQEHYNDGGWDVIAECWDDEQIRDVIREEGARTAKTAIAAFAGVIDVWADRQAEAARERDAAVGNDTPGLGYQPDRFVLDVHICDQRRGYRVEFATEAQAVEFFKRKAAEGNHAFEEVRDTPVPLWARRLLDLLYPKCEHGMDAGLCAGPGHYPRDEYGY